MLRYVLISVQFLVFTVAGWAQLRKITGRILDAETQKPISGVQVAIEGSTNAATTNALGYFEASLDSSDKSLTVSHAGYRPATIDIPVQDRFRFSMRKGGDKKSPRLAEFYHYFMQNLKYPAQARRMGIEGILWIQFSADSAGNISNVVLLRDNGPDCAKEGTRCLSAIPPALISLLVNETCETSFILPITFGFDGPFRPLELPNDDGPLVLSPIEVAAYGASEPTQKSNSKRSKKE